MRSSPEKKTKHSEAPLNFFDIAILLVLTSMVVLSPLAMGSVAPWARNLLFILSLLTTALWLVQAFIRGRLVVVRDPILLLIALFFLVMFFQLIPFEPSTLNAISPGTTELYENSLPGYPASGEARTISLTPYHTAEKIRYAATFALAFLVIVHTFRSRLQVTILILALVAVGTFEALYGLGEQFSGGKNIFWNQRLYHMAAVTGTFVNKNHFAGFLEMVVPLALGLFMVSVPNPNRGGNFRARAVNAVSSPGLHRQIILGTLVAGMAIALFFSLSRAGISGAIASWTAFFLIIAVTAGVRKYTLGLILLVLVILCVALGMGSEMVFEKMEDAASGESVSWTARIDLWGSAVAMIKDFPLLGTGFGTFEEAFERYQSSRFGDRYADYLHNDWLQVFCETGIIGGLLFVGGVILLFIRLTRATLSRRDVFSRWIATGALTACAAMLMHSFFDYNLYKISSNALTFGIVVGIWYVAAHMAGKNKRSRNRTKTLEIPLGPKAVRSATALICVALLVFLAIQPARTTAANISLNRHLASVEGGGQPDYYFFLPLPRASLESATGELVRACNLDGDNPNILYYMGREEVRRADKMVWDGIDKSLGGIPVGYTEGDSASLAALRESLFLASIKDMADDRRPYLEAAKGYYQRAIAAAPAMKRFHLSCAEIQAEPALSTGDHEGDFPGEAEARRALWLAPEKPGALYRVGRIFLVNTLNNTFELEDSPAWDTIKECFRRSIASDPEYANEIFPLLEKGIKGDERFFAVTPKTIKGYELLTRFLKQRKKWEAVLRSLTMETEICELALKGEGQGASVGSSELTDAEALSFVAGSTAFVPYDLHDLQIRLLRERATILSILRRFDERKKESQQCLILTRSLSDKNIKEVRKLADKLRLGEAYSTIRILLQTDWANPEALLLATELAHTMETLNRLDSGDSSIDKLFSLVLHNEEITSDIADSVTDKLAQFKPHASWDSEKAAFIEGAVNVLAGRLEKGLSQLRELAIRLEAPAGTESGLPWPQQHLVWYYYGKGLERAGKNPEAVEAYAKVIESTPTHLDALRRLFELDGTRTIHLPEWTRSHLGLSAEISVTTLIEKLRPQVATNICFGGKVVLLGYTVSTAGDDEAEKSWPITYFWQFLEHVSEEYQPTVFFRSDDEKLMFQDHHRFLDGMELRSYGSPACGSVVVDRRKLTQNPGKAYYMTIGIQSSAPSSRSPLKTDCGNLLFKTKAPLSKNS